MTFQFINIKLYSYQKFRKLLKECDGKYQSFPENLELTLKKHVFKSTKCSLTVSELSDFKNKMANNIEFHNIKTFTKNSKMTSMRLKLVIKYLSLEISLEI